MKIYLLFSFLVSASVSRAQTFTEIPTSYFDGVDNSSIAFSDIDGDGDQDVLITGENSSDKPISKLYTNDGMGSFTEARAIPFEGVSYSSVAFSDVDGDEDQDVLITGRDSTNEPISKLYTNDGAGNFTEAMGTPFEGVDASSIAFSDVDGDGDQDVLITGWDNSNEPISKLYTNDGMGSFTEVTDTPFGGVANGSIAFSDVDGDGDQDVLITGWFGVSKLYTNDGKGSFTEAIGRPFLGAAYGSIAFSDVDGDGDQDVLITGENEPLFSISKLYTNDGMGSYTKVTGMSFVGVSFSSIAFSDVDNDGDQDVLITGSDGFFGPLIAKLYTNNGMGDFTEVKGTPFSGVVTGSIAFSDVDGDGDQDVLITGYGPGPISKLYTNDGVVSPVLETATRASFDFLPYPNPSVESLLYIRYSSGVKAEVFVSVFDLNERLVKYQREQIETGIQDFSIDISSLKKGSYIIQIDDGVNTGAKKFLVH